MNLNILSETYETVDELFVALGQLGYTGTINDRTYAYLSDQGYSGALNDRLLSFFNITFAPDNLAGLVGWFDASVGVTTTGSSVDNWEDQTGTGDLSATLGDRPLYSASGADGIPVVYETNSDWFMSMASRNVVHAFFKMRMNTQGTTTRFLNNGTPRWLSSPTRIDVAVADTFSKGGTQYLDDVHLVNMAGPNNDVYDFALGSSAAVTGLGIKPTTVGFSLQAEIAEILLYDREITGSDLTDVRNYLAY